MIDADQTLDGQRVLGNILNLMTGNTSGVIHDAAWWRAWWKKNASRFPADVRSMEVPHLALRQRQTTPFATRGPEQHLIGGDVKRTYWLVSPVASGRGRIPAIGAPPGPPGQPAIAPAAKAAADSDLPGLLVVLPPDGNGADGALFWQTLEQKSLKNNYLVAVAVAPKWSQTQPAVWLTADNVKQVKEARFDTAKFVADIVQDIVSTRTIAASRIYLHGATDSGPIAYACSLEDTTPFRGFYILASVFKSANLPPLTRAKGRHYVVQHSPEDKSAPYFMAAAAQKTLKDHQAIVDLLPYAGSHGYLFTDQAADPIGEAIAALENAKK